MRNREEAGSITPMVIGFMLIVAMLVAVVVDASAAFLQRQRLNSIADAAALAATDGLQGDQVYSHGLGELARIDAATAHHYAAAEVAASGAARDLPGLQLSVRAETNTVVVTVRAPLDLPLKVPGVAEQAMISGTAASVVAVSP